MGAPAQPVIRPAAEPDADGVASLLYESAGGMYDRFAGGHDRALRVIDRAFATDGNNASRDVVTVAEVDGRIAGALAAFPVDEMPGRASAFLRLTLRSIPLWRWPGCLWLYWSGLRSSPPPPRSSFYIDALATDAGLRRRGVARTLLEEAERQARALGLPAVALDTSLRNKPARALYVSSGYDEVAYRPPGRGLPGFVALVKPLY
jgi:ribosomal protein S18 acetylase RimI-like enzyme